MVLHSTLSGANLHDPKGVSPTPLALAAGLGNAYRIDDESANAVFLIDTSADKITLGHTTAITSLQMSIADAAANAFRVTGPASDYIHLNTNTAPEVISLGDTTNNVAVRMTGDAAFRFRAMANTTRDGLTAGTGDVIWSNDDTQLQVYNGTSWEGVGGGGLPHALTDNNADQPIVQEGTNDYIRAVTTDAGEALELMGHDLQRHVYIGPIGGTADNDPSLFFESGNASANRTLEMRYVGNNAGAVEEFSMFFDSGNRFFDIDDSNVSIGVDVSTPTTSQNVFIGDSAGGEGGSGVVIGHASTIATGANNCILIGANSSITAGGADQAIIIGAGSTTNTGLNGIGLGFNVLVGHNNSVCIGRDTESTATNQFVVGSTNMPVTSYVLGEGVTDATAPAITLETTGGTATNAGGAWTSRGGLGGAGSGASAGGAGGTGTFAGGAGGAGTASGLAGVGGAVTIAGGGAGADGGGGGAAGGAVAITGGAGTGAGADGQIDIGVTSTNAVKLCGTGVEMRDSTNSAGTATNVWTSNGAGAAPGWAAAGGGGLPHTVTPNVETVIVDEATTGDYINVWDNAGQEQLFLCKNDTRRQVTIGDSGSNTDVDPFLYMYGGTGAANRYWYFQVDGGNTAFIGNLNGTQSLFIDDGRTHIGFGAATGTSSTAFGDNANSAGSSQVVIGRNASGGTGATTTAVGHGASCLGATSVCIGGNSQAQQNSTAVGHNVDLITGTRTTGVGEGVQSTHNQCLLLGRGATSTADNQGVLGSGANAINNFYFGQGVNHTTAPNGVTLHATSGSGAVAGSSMTIAPGVGGQAGQNGGSVKLQYADENTAATGLSVLGGLDESTSYPAGTIQMHQGIGNSVWRVPINTTISTNTYSTVHTIAVATDRHYSVVVRLLLTRTAAGDEGFAGYNLFGVVSNDSGTTDENGGTAIVGDADNTSTSQRRGIARAATDAWKCRIIADDTADTIDIDCQGSDGKTINVKGYIEVIEG